MAVNLLTSWVPRIGNEEATQRQHNTCLHIQKLGIRWTLSMHNIMKASESEEAVLEVRLQLGDEKNV